MRTVAIIPARGGSKGIPGKNLRELRGRPLVAHAIDVGRATCGMVAVTSDDPRVLEVAAQYRATPLIRPPGLAEDDTPMLPVLRHAVEALGVAYDVAVLLQPTQPLRKPEHVRAALAMLADDPCADSVVSVVEVPQAYSPSYTVRVAQRHGRRLLMGADESLDRGVTRRQDAVRAHYRDGTVYAIRCATLESGRLYGDRCVPLEIPAHESATLDTEADWTRLVTMVT